MSNKFTLASIGAEVAALQAIAADVLPLLQYAAKAMTIAEANTSMAGPDKKTAVLNMVSVVAADAGKDFALIAADVGAFIDTAKTLYNDAVAAVNAVAAAVSGAAPNPQ